MNPSFVEIVRARPEDLPEVQRLAGVIWRAYYPAILSSAQIEYMLARGYSLEALERFINGGASGLELARVDGGLVGFAAWLMSADPRTAKLDKLYLLPERQRLGLGGRLIARVAELAHAAGAATLILNVNKYNAQAIRAYEKHGFTVREPVVVDIGEGFVMDDYVMAKDL